MPALLSGVRVLDAATNIAGPYGASVLADLGAQVVKIEPLGGDPMRKYPPFVEGGTTQYAAVNHRKRYLALDLRQPAGRRLLHRLVLGSDVLVQNLRRGHEQALGLDAASLHDVNPRLVHATVTAFHPVDGARPGYDLLVQAESGLIDMTGESDRPPSRIGVSAIDHVSALWLALGILGALSGARERSTVEVSMIDVALALANEKISAYLATGEAPRRLGGATTTTTPHGTFPTADAYIVIGAATDDSFRRLAGALGPPIEGDERFATQQGRLDHRAELERLIGEALSRHGADHWLRVLDDAGVPVGRVHTLPEAIDRHRRHSQTGILPVSGTPIEVVAPPLLIDGAAWGPLEPPSGTGGDTDAVLADAGLSAGEIAELRAAEIVR